MTDDSSQAPGAKFGQNTARVNTELPGSGGDPPREDPEVKERRRSGNKTTGTRDAGGWANIIPHAISLLKFEIDPRVAATRL